MYILKILIFLQLFFLVISNQNINPSPRTGPQDLLVTHYDCEENEQKTLHKHAINQVSQCETEPQAIESTNVIATLYSKARATTVIGYKFTAIKTDLTTNHFTKVISNDFYISIPMILKTSYSD